MKVKSEKNPAFVVEQLALEGLATDEGHHKQWYLEEILKTLGYSEEEIQSESEDWGFERGIAP